MAQTKITKDTGATIKPGPMVVAGPEQVVADDDLAQVAAGSGLNGPFVADPVASMAAHENDGIALFRALGAMTANPMLQAKYRQMRQDAEQAVGAYESLITTLVGRVSYISPAARMTECLDGKILEAFLGSGAADPLVLELKGIEAVLLASTLCVANVSLLDQIATGVDDGPVKTALERAVGELRGPSEEHLEWAASTQRTMVLSQARSALAQKGMAAMETVVGKIKDVLNR